MDSHKIDDFLMNILSHIKYPFVKEDIRKELKEHILDKIDYYMEENHDRKTAEELAIKDMGEPKEIGVQLNKEHNPIIGWLMTITSVLIGLLIFFNIIFTGMILLISIFNSNPIKQIPKEDIVYRIDINEKVQIDNRVIKFTNVIYDKSGELHILYRHYDKKFWRMGWGFGNIGAIIDDKGNEYFSGSGSSTGGFVSKGRRGLRDFPSDAKTLIIEYDSYNRYYKVEIPLKSGDNNE